MANHERCTLPVAKRANASKRTQPRTGNQAHCVVLVTKRANAGGTGEAGACAKPAARRCGTPQGRRGQRALKQ